jgi:hypothetical protein
MVHVIPTYFNPRPGPWMTNEADFIQLGLPTSANRFW